MMPLDFLYCLVDDMGRSYTVNNGIVETSSTPAPLPISPDGWQDKSIKYARNLKSSSLWRTYTNPLKFVKQGALIVRHFLYTKGTEAKIDLLIHRLDKRFAGGWIHRFFYKGELDLSQAEDNDTNISVNVMEGGLSKLLKANENTPYEIDINVPEAVDVKMEGPVFLGTRKWVVPSVTLTGELAAAHQSPISYVSGEFDNIGIVGGTQTPGNPDGFFILSAEDNQVFDWSGKIRVKVNNFVFLLMATLFRRRADGSTVTEKQDVINPPSAGQWYEFSYDYTDFELDANEELFITIIAGGIPGSVNQRQIDYEATEFQADFKYRYRTTFIKGLRPLYVAQALLDKITGGGYAVTSEYLSTSWENLLVTSGDAIRGFENAKLKISWSEFFDSYNVPCNLCYGIRDNELYIEEKEKAFQSNIQLAMGEVKELVVNTAKDFQYNTVNVGYPDTDTEDVNGRDEFNVTQVYTSPIKRPPAKTLDLVSKIRASMYEIELTRINLDGKVTTDDNNDTRSFFLHVEKTATIGTGSEPATYYKLLRNTYDSITGIIDPVGAFNVELHPELCLKRHGNYLRGIFYWQESGTLDYQTSDKNGNMVVMKDGQIYIGDKNISIGGLAPAPLFIPLTFQFESPMEYEIVDIMDAGPDGTFSFQYNGDTYYGFPMEVSIQPANRPAQETLLLCSPQTNLNNLISMSR
jgi:hypothetical protein